MSDDLVKRIKDRGDWLVDAVATATQNRMFLRGEPECDDVACDAIRMNGEKAMSQIAKPLADRIEELEAKLAKAVAFLEEIAVTGDWFTSDMSDIIKELKGESHEDDKRMHFRCGECDTNFSTPDAVFPMDVKKLSKLVRETKCPTCGAGSKRLYLRANVKEEKP